MTKLGLISLAAMGFLTACSGPRVSPAEAACQDVTRHLMRSPTTMEVASSFAHERDVFLEIDAANAYGTPVRHSIRCTLSPDGVSPQHIEELVIDGVAPEPYALLAAQTRASNDRLRDR